MPREPLRLTRSVLAAYRSGALVAVAEGEIAGIPVRRPRGYFDGRALAAVALAASATAPIGPGPGVIQIRGAMTQYEQLSACGEPAHYGEIVERFCCAQRDPGVGAVVIDADTPGGDVPGLEEGIEAMLACKAECDKATIGYVGARCFSAGVWMLTAICDRIIVHPSARFGSIGVLIGHETDARRAKDQGYDRTIVRDPPGKANPSPDEQLDELGLARLQELVTATRARFVASVMKARPASKLDAAKILGWNGAIFTGAAAIDAGLVDALGSLTTTIQIATALAAMQEAA